MRKAHLAMPVRALRDIVAAALPAVSKDEITPVLTGALFTLDAGRLTIIGTDRYRVHRVRGRYEGSRTGEFLVPRGALEWVIKNAGFFGRTHYIDPVARIDFAYEPDTVPERSPKGTVIITLSEHDGADAKAISYSLPLIQGKFPPVHRLIEKADVATERLRVQLERRLDLLTDAKKIARDLWEGGEIRIVQPNTGGNKPGQILVAYENGEALLQLMETPTKGAQ